VERVEGMVRRHYAPTRPRLVPLDVALLARTRTRSRETRPQGRRVRSSAASRDGPLASDDDEADLTPLQVAVRLVGELFRLASELTPDEFVVWLSILTSRIARENGRISDWGES
jgi:hypothetical protein